MDITMSDELGYFVASRQNFEIRLQEAVFVSEKAKDRPSEWAGMWGSILHARVILNGGSMIKIIEAATGAAAGAELLDHFSVASIARTAMEAGVMTLYVTDPNASEDDFEMRRKVLLLHDTCHRSRMFRSGEKQSTAIKEMRDMYRQKIIELRMELEAMPNFAMLPETTRARIIEGRDFYVGGVRGALNLIGWEKSEYDFYESYFSSYVHSMPVSFLRVGQHEIDFATISPFQYTLCGVALNAVSDTLARTTARMHEIL
jgi:hypothetical protein